MTRLPVAYRTTFRSVLGNKELLRCFEFLAEVLAASIASTVTLKGRLNIFYSIDID